MEERRTLADKYRVVTPNVFNPDDTLIWPTLYSSRLRGALVEIRFTLCHYMIDNNEGKVPKNTFVAEVEEMRVVVPPAPYAGKKRVLQCDNAVASGSSAKKPRTVSEALGM